MKTYIITGGNSGLGFETAKAIAQKSNENRVILACRNTKKAAEAAEKINSLTGNNSAVAMELDLCSFNSIRCFAKKIKDQGIIISGLDNNAGISGMTPAGLTEDGFDIVFQSNCLGHFLLTNLLLPQMAKDSRILNISSDMHFPPFGEIQWKGTEALAHPSGEFAADSARYSYSKLCNLYFTYTIAERLRQKGSAITVNAITPGFMGDTGFMAGHITQEHIEMVKTKMPNRFGNLKKSSQAAADLLTEPEFAAVTSKYFDRSTTPIKSSPLSYNKANAKDLWEKSEEYTKFFDCG